MITDQDIYNIAEWLTYNREDFFINSSNRDVIKHFIIRQAKDHFPEYGIDDIHIAFEDERVAMIFNFYYVTNNDRIH